MNWLFFVRAAIATLQGLSTTTLPLWHGGAATTATKVNSAIQVLGAFVNGTADQLTAADVHPDLAAHAAAIATTDPHAQPAE